MDERSVYAVNELLKKYKDMKNLEFEFRFKNVDKEIFSNVHARLLKSPEFTFNNIEYSINATSDNIFGGTEKNNTTNYIRRILFDSTTGKKVNDEHMKKKSITRIPVAGFISYTINLSEETPCENFSSQMNASIRFKLRSSFLTLDKQWRIDLTAVKSTVLKNIGPEIKQMVTKMFIPTDAKSFVETLNYDELTGFELEIEHVGDKNLLDAGSLSIAKKILSIIDPTYVEDSLFKEEINRVAAHIIEDKEKLTYFKYNPGLKRLLNQAISLTANAYAEIQPSMSNFYLTEKADGIRCIVSIAGNTCRVLTDKVLEIPYRPTNRAPTDVIIVEGEYISWTDPETSQTTVEILLFDALVVNGNPVFKDDFKKRSATLPTIAELINMVWISNIKVGLANIKAIKVSSKKFIDCALASPTNNIFRKLYESKFNYEIDGLILTSTTDNYQNTKSYKWKPTEHNTIDFMTVKAPSEILGKFPYMPRPNLDLYILFVGCSAEVQKKLGITTIVGYNKLFPTVKTQSYYPIQFTPSAAPTDHIFYAAPDQSEKINYKVVEYKKDKVNAWELVRVREDRKLEPNYFGNDYRIAELTYSNYLNPLSVDDLVLPPRNYFTKDANTTYKAANGYKRFIIGNLISHYMKNASEIIDLGAGRGADLGRYFENGVHRGLFIDIDKAALAELVERKFSIINDKRKQHKIDKFRRTQDTNQVVLNREASTGGMQITTMQADLKTPVAELIEQTEKLNFMRSTIVAMNSSFVFHYLCDNTDSLRNVIQYIKAMLKPGGTFSFTTLNGESVFNTLKSTPHGEQYQMPENNIIKYAFKKLYVGDALSDIGQKISVKLPFIEEMVEEPLCNINYVIKEFEKHGFSVELNYSLSKQLDAFKEANIAMYNNLTPVDLTYIGLHQYVLLRLSGKPKK